MIIKGGTIVNEGRSFRGDIVIEDGKIINVNENDNDHSPLTTHHSQKKIINAEGCYVLPGIIDSHVHFREPGLTAKADIDIAGLFGEVP